MLTLNTAEKNPKAKLSKAHLALLIKDDLMAETMLVQMQKHGFHTTIHHTVKSLEQEYLLNETPDIVIIDMDDFNFEGIICLNQDDRNDNFKLFALSGKNTMQTRLQAVKAAADGFFTKPLDIAKLAKHITYECGLKRQMIKEVMVIDDDPMILRYCQKFLEPLNIRIRCVESPMLTLQELENKKPDLVLLDFHMPEVNGLDTKKVIRQIYDRNEIPILFMTGTQDEAILKDLQRTSSIAPIMKPLQKEDFIRKIIQILENTPSIH